MLNNLYKSKVRLSAIGGWLTFLAIFLLLSAQNTGNNLLYLVSSCVFSGLFLALVEALYSKNTISVELNYPKLVEVGENAEIICKITNRRKISSYFFRFENSYIEKLSPSANGYLRTSIPLKKTGRYAFKGLSIYQPGVLGIFYIKTILPEFSISSVDKLTSGGYPAERFLGKASYNDICHSDGREGDFWSQELYQDGDDSSKINWTVSARSLDEWVIVRTQSEDFKEPKRNSQEPSQARVEPPNTHETVLGITYSAIIRNAQLKELTPFTYRLISSIALVACIGVYNTGFHPSLLAWIFSLIILFGIKGSPLPASTHRAVYYSCFIPAIYALSKSLMPGASSRIILLLEFSLTIMFLQLVTMKNIRNAFACLTLVLMIILGIAAMNVNFAFPIIFLPFLILASTVLSFFRYNIVSTSKASQNIFAISPKGLRSTILIFIIFLLLWIPFFYLIPRTSSYGIAAELSDRRSKGFSSSTMELNGSGFLENNHTVAMRIKPNEEKTNTTSIIRRLRNKHIRGNTFSEYENGVWKKMERGFHIKDLRPSAGEIVLDQNFSDFKSLHSFEIIIEGVEGSNVFIPQETKLISLNRNFIGYEKDGSMYFLNNKLNSNRKYNIQMLIESEEIKDSPIDDLLYYSYSRDIISYLSLNGSTDRIQALAGKLQIENGTIAQQAQKVVDFLRNNYSYTTMLPQQPNETDPVEHFLFESKQGICQHFATSMVFLLRSMGIPCRVVNGYTMGEWNDIGGFFTVRQNNAHAWVEVFFPKSGWVSYDPTPPDDEEEENAETMLVFQKIIEIYEGFWFTYIYSFDMNAQISGIKKMLPRFQDIIKVFFYNPPVWGSILIILVFTLIFKKYIFATIRYMNGKYKWLPYSYFIWEAKCFDSTSQRKPNETPAEYHKRLFAEGKINSEALKKLTELESLIDEYAFNPRADKPTLLSQISRKLKFLKIQ